MIWRPQAPDLVQVGHKRSFDDYTLRLGDIMRGERATLGKSLLDVQRELKIKAAYIAAIENADPTAFDTPGFVAGYVRSYARFLGLDPEWAYETFCREGKFETAHGMSALASGRVAKAGKPEPVRKKAEPRDPFSDPTAPFVPKGRSSFSGIEPGALGSVAVLIALIGVIGYGGWTVLQEVQKVRFAPVEQTPDLISDLDPMGAGEEFAAIEVEEDEDIAAPSLEAFDRLYRPEALEVPVLVSRDAPISTLDPRQQGTLAALSEATTQAPRRLASAEASDSDLPQTERRPAEMLVASADGEGEAVASGIDAALAEAMGVTAASAVTPEDADTDRVQVLAEPAPGVTLFAVRETWVRVSAADGTVILEKIMQPGENFALPNTVEPPTLRTGNAGGLYFAVNDQTYGPAGENGRVVGNLVLAADSVSESFAVADLERDADLAGFVRVADNTTAE